MVWTVISIPKEEKDSAVKTAVSVGLRIADGVPHIITAGKSYTFPMATKNVFTLENTPGHEIYKNDPKVTERYRFRYH